jgi:F0F1-type ATP synthase delta subunit
MENAYAQALWTVIAKGTKPHDAVRIMHEKLKAEGREALMPRIARAYARLAARESNRTRVTLAVADKAHEHLALKSAAAEIASLGIDEKDVEVRVDPTLIGGWRLEGREALVDSSYKKHLLAIYHAATHA